MITEVNIVGGGLAGSEAALQLADRGYHVKLFEMRPDRNTEAHRTGKFAELVCSNSLGSSLENRPSGLLQKELELLGSHLLLHARKAALPAGSALAVDRQLFSELVHNSIVKHPNIQVHRTEITEIPPGYSIIASGPLTSQRLTNHLVSALGQPNLQFYDALAPIVLAGSIDMTIAFTGSRYNRGQTEEGDYINCPFSRGEYQDFVKALLSAETVLKTHAGCSQSDSGPGQTPRFFEACLPIEELARRGEKALAFGPMRPIGLRDSRRDEIPAAVVQLRQDNLAGNLYNIVGFQTNLTYAAQAKVFRMIPGLQNAEFIRFGQMHRNTFINSPALLEPTLQLRTCHKTFIAGQLAGVEGYLGSIACGLVSALNMVLLIENNAPAVFPKETMIGSLLWYITHADQNTFQPMKANFGLLPDLPRHYPNKTERNDHLVQRSLDALRGFIDERKIKP